MYIYIHRYIYRYRSRNTDILIAACLLVLPKNHRFLVPNNHTEHLTVACVLAPGIRVSHPYLHTYT